MPNIAVRTVATIDGPAGIPAAVSTAGFTTTMYDMVRNVVTPATISRLNVVPALSSSKKRLIADTG